jgi:hypothetical protein
MSPPPKRLRCSPSRGRRWRTGEAGSAASAWLRMRQVVAASASATLLAACASGPPAPAWQTDAQGATERAARAYLRGESKVHEAELARVRAAVASTGRVELAARVELMDCALRAAALDVGPCTRFEALRADAAAPERAYADYLAGRALTHEAMALLPPAQQAAAGARASGAAVAPAATQGIEDPLSRLIALAVLLQAGSASPALMEQAADTASAQGWRRPLLAWLKVQALRAEKAGDTAALAALQRRIALVASQAR